ncbi:complement C1q tumor necrosis factor-related protein 3-like [Archocentrus centrarchus]|uniref:complement C1q tumor necrosis factor-related protein 3-like n=1 Tax=Archocentrus centrarchus TaxID=63155 RepID=UPI0011E9DA24|nr:complement C1q tumor necrosis factor-related protein 3-like [Archocentrus centrarchus]
MFVGTDPLWRLCWTAEELQALVHSVLASGGRSQVAFSASLTSTSQWTHQGPFKNVSPLVFREVKTNIGNAYDPDTGVFTKPTNGLYNIRFTGSIGKSGSLNAAVLKNGENMFAIYNTVGRISSNANGMTLVLNEGDRVWVVLWPNQSISDKSGLSTFSGFLIFPM